MSDINSLIGSISFRSQGNRKIISELYTITNTQSLLFLVLTVLNIIIIIIFLTNRAQDNQYYKSSQK